MKKSGLVYVLILVVVMMLMVSCSYRNVVTTPIFKMTIAEVKAEIPEPATVTDIRESIMFKYDSSVIEAIEMKKVEEIAGVMALYPDTTLALKGYASSEGKSDYNGELSLKRAEAVKSELLSMGVAEDRILVLGNGETNEFGELLELNRRVLVLSMDE
jgi:outer membrane protein OmpA-like peptidoglycan-associated protein